MAVAGGGNAIIADLNETAGQTLARELGSRAKFVRTDVTEPALQPRPDRVHPDAAELLVLTDAGWRSRFGKSAMTRAKRRGLARNAAVALGNRRDPRTLPALRAAAESDPDPVVRTHASWALTRFE